MGGETATRASSAPLTVTLLGGFEVRLGHEVLPIPPGLPAQGVKYVALRGGRVHHEELIDVLWPDATLVEGRKGLRNLLARLGRAACPVLLRDGAVIRLVDGAQVDATGFREAADRVLVDPDRPGAVPAARAALARYSGDLLPDDLYADWAGTVREGLARRRLALIDLLAVDARRRRAVPEAVNLLEMAIELDPYDEIRYLEVAQLLIAGGRLGRAAACLTRSQQVLRSHGLLPGPGWLELERQLRQAGPSADELVAAGAPADQQ